MSTTTTTTTTTTTDAEGLTTTATVTATFKTSTAQESNTELVNHVDAETPELGGAFGYHTTTHATIINNSEHVTYAYISSKPLDIFDDIAKGLLLFSFGTFAVELTGIGAAESAAAFVVDNAAVEMGELGGAEVLLEVEGAAQGAAAGGGISGRFASVFETVMDKKEAIFKTAAAMKIFVGAINWFKPKGKDGVDIDALKHFHKLHPGQEFRSGKYPVSLPLKAKLVQERVDFENNRKDIFSCHASITSGGPRSKGSTHHYHVTNKEKFNHWKLERSIKLDAADYHWTRFIGEEVEHPTAMEIYGGWDHDGRFDVAPLMQTCRAKGYSAFVVQKNVKGGGFVRYKKFDGTPEEQFQELQEKQVPGHSDTFFLWRH